MASCLFYARERNINHAGKYASFWKAIESKFVIKIPGGSAELLAELNRICGRSNVLKLTFERGSALIYGGKNRNLRLLASASLSRQKGNVVGFVYKSTKDFM